MKDLIQRIIDARKPKKITAEAQLKEVVIFESTIESLKSSLEQSGDYGVDKIVFCVQILEKTKQLKEKLERLIERFGRDYIAIAAFGKTQDGKSTFWKSLTGLIDEGTIPIGANQAAAPSCTMVKVSYFNISSAEKKEGCVLFYSTTEFIEYINEQLSCASIGERITSLNDIKKLKTSVENKLGSQTDEGEKNKLKRLLAFVKHYDFYKHRITDNGDSIEIELNEVGTYVRNEINGKENINYFPVKEVIIKTVINEDFGKIKFIDTRGTGEQAHLIEEQLAKTLCFDSDGGLFIRRYIPGFGITLVQHTNICNIIKKLKGSEVPWVQFVPNCSMQDGIDGDSLKNIEKFVAGNLKGDDLKPLVVFNPATDVIDCAKEEKVRDLVERFVQYLATNISDIDRKLEENLTDTYDEITKLVLKLRNINPPRQLLNLKNDMIKIRIEKLCGKISEIANKRFNDRNKVDEEFQKEYSIADEVTAETICPGLETEFNNKSKSYGAVRAYCCCTDKLRFKFIDIYAAGASFLVKVNELKKEIVNIFNDAGIKLLLGDSDDSLKRIINIDSLKIGGEMRKLLCMLSDFNININSSFLYLLRYSTEFIRVDENSPQVNRISEIFESVDIPSVQSLKKTNSTIQSTNSSQSNFVISPSSVTAAQNLTNIQSSNNSWTFARIEENFKKTKTAFNELFSKEYEKSNLILFGFTDDFVDRIRFCEDCNKSLFDFFIANFDETFTDMQKAEIYLIESQIYIYKSITDLKIPANSLV